MKSSADVEKTGLIPPLDFESSVTIFGGDRASVLGLIHDFLRLLDIQLELVATALTAGDAETIRREAHSIKGGASVLAADDLAQAASALELLGGSGDLAKGEEGVRQLDKEVRRLRSYYEELQGRKE